jgi:hypothetical protein
MKYSRCGFRFVLASLLLSTSLVSALAQAPTVSQIVSTINNDSANDGNFATGVALFERATITGTAAAYGFIRQGTQNLSLFTRPDSINPNFYSATIPYAGPSTLTGSWTYHVSSSPVLSSFTPPSPTLTFPLPTSPSVGSIGIMPFVDSMSASAGTTPLTPTISWVLPSTSGTDAFGTALPSINKIVIGVSDNTAPIVRTNVNPFAAGFGNSFTQANLIYNSGPLAATTTTFTLPTTNDNSVNSNFGAPVLQFGHTYSIAISLQHDTGATPVPGCSLCTVSSRSNSFFDYTPINPVSLGLPANTVINLPSTVPVPTTSGLFAGPVYSFNVASVGPSSATFIDPLVANGFIYTIGAGDPNFATVEAVTHVGNGIYQLLGWTGTQFAMLDSTFAAGDVFDFLTHGFANGLSKFEIIGIDPGVNPTDITAFVTGLTFVAEGSFTGTMEPIVADSTTPLPGAFPLFATGLGLIGLITTRRRRRERTALR